MLHHIVNLIFDTIWFFLPALLANGAPALGVKLCSVFNNKKSIIFRFLRRIYRPISTFWLGQNKTYGGWLLGILVSILVVLFQTRGILIGLIMGIGVMMGDTIKSFIKRRFDIKPGKYIIWDTIDWFLGVLLLLFMTNHLPTKEIIIIAIFLCPVIVLIVNFISFKLKIKTSL